MLFDILGTGAPLGIGLFTSRLERDTVKVVTPTWLPMVGLAMATVAQYLAPDGTAADKAATALITAEANLLGELTMDRRYFE